MAAKARGFCLRCGRTARIGSLCDRHRVAGAYKDPAYVAAQRAAKGYLGQRCEGCREVMTEGNPPTVDHETPVAQGGGRGRLRVRCRSCNSRRGAGSTTRRSDGKD